MKRILPLFLCLVMVFFTLSAAGAQAAQLSDGEPAVIIYERPAQEASAKCGDTRLKVEMSTLAEENTPVTYFCLVDLASSYDAWAYNNIPSQQVAALQQISSRLRTGDKMILATMGQELKVTELSGDENERQAACTAIRDNWAQNAAYFTNLYQNTVEALNQLSDTEKYPGIRQLVILSDGNNRSQASTTLADVTAAIAESGIAVSMIGTIREAADYSLNTLKTLDSSLAGAKTGVLISPVRDNVTPAQAADKVVDNILAMSVLRIGTDEIPRGEETVQLQLTLDGQSVTAEVAASELPEVRVVETTPPETEPVTEAATEPSIEETTAAAQEPAQTVIPLLNISLSKTSIVLLCVAAGAVALIAIMLLLSRIRSNREEEYEEEPDENDGASDELINDTALQEQIHSVSPDFFGEIDMLTDTGETEAPEQTESGSACRISFCDHRSGRIICRFELAAGATCTAGRSTRSDVVLNAGDAGMSGVHFELYWDGSILYLRDRNSTNGTFVNNVPQEPQQWVELANDSDVGAGSHTYRIVVTPV